MKGIIEKVTCPLLVVHGARNNIVAVEEIERLKQEATGPVALMVYEDGNHSVCNPNLEMSETMADWVADQHLEKDGALSKGGPQGK